MPRWTSLLAVTTPLLFPSVAPAQSASVVITPGIGHDRFTETFFLDDSTSVSLDSLERIKKTQSDLQESYASLGLGLESKRWRLDNTVYATNKVWRNIANGHGRWSAGKWKTDLNGRLEWKGKSRGDTSAAAFTYARIDVIPRWRWNEQWSLLLAGDWELTDYLRNTSYTYDYNRVRLQTGVEYFGDRLENLEARIGLARRTVSDSSQLGYTEDFLRLEASGWQFGRWRLESGFSFAVRDFKAPDNADDYSRWATSTNIGYDWSPRWRVTLQAAWQYWDYRQPDEFSFNVHDIRTEGAVRFNFDDVWEIGAAIELRAERAVQDSLAVNDYDQWALGPRLVWNSGSAFWSEIAPRAGYRNYATVSIVYDDYSFWEIMWQADLLGPLGTTVSATITYLSERHADRTRDSAYLYISAALRFPIHL